MPHSTISGVLASGVATNGTFAVTYPSGKTKGNFINGADHRLVVLQTELKVGNGFTISLGNSSATITYTGTTTIPAGSAFVLQLDETGGSPVIKPNLLRTKDLVYRMIELGSPVLADADGISASQSISSGVEAVMDGALVDTSVSGIVLDVPRNIVAAWTTSAVLTIKGYDEYGVYMVEKSASGTSHTGNKAFKRVTSLTFSASVTSCTIGTGSKLGLPVFLRDVDQIAASFENAVKVDAGGRKHYIPFEIEQTQLLAPTNEQIVSPVAGRITGYRGICQAAVTTGGAVTLKIGTTDVTGASITLANSDTAGTVYNSSAITAANTVAVGDRIQVVPAAAIDTAGELNGMIEITQDGINDAGTWVVGSQAAVSGTSGDVRGTFTPNTTMDGVVSFAFLIAVDNPTYLGAPQYAG